MTRRICVLTALVLVLSGSSIGAETVQIPGPSGPLEGELLAPDDAAHVVVLIPGSGPIDRDGNSPQFDSFSQSYRLLATALFQLDIATLRVDKRGFFGSSAAIANPNDVTIAAYAKDARAWVVRAQEVAECVWLAGHSEGALVSLVAARDLSDSLCGLILLSAPGRPVGHILLEQMRSNPFNAQLMPTLEGLVADLNAGSVRDTATLPVEIRPMFSEGLQRYMIDLFSYDPAEVAKAWNGPVLLVHADRDIQISDEDVSRLHAVLPQGHRVNLMDGTHMLKVDVPGRPFATYRDPALPLHPALAPAMSAFVKRLH